MGRRSLGVLVVVPAFNEEASVGDVVRGIRSSLSEATVLVIDDGSTDATGSVAARAGAIVAPHAVNLGVGAAVRTGLQFAVGQGYRVVVQVDADGQHDPDQIRALVEGLDGADVVVGARFGAEDPYPMSRVRRLAIRLLSRLASMHCRTRLTDATSGFRAWGPRAIALFSQHYPSEYLGDTVESLVLAGRVGLTVREIPASMQPRVAGRPSQSAFVASLHLSRALFVALQSFIRSVPPGARDLVEAEQ